MDARRHRATLSRRFIERRGVKRDQLGDKVRGRQMGITHSPSCLARERGCIAFTSLLALIVTIVVRRRILHTYCEAEGAQWRIRAKWSDTVNGIRRYKHQVARTDLA